MTHQWMKILALLCALLMILTTAVACANDADGDPSDSSEDESANNGDESGTTDKEPDTIVYAAKIPDGYSCNNESFVVYTYPQDVFVWKDYDWQNSGNITGDRINDAVFRRTAQVEEELTLVIEYYCGVFTETEIEVMPTASSAFCPKANG